MKQDVYPFPQVPSGDTVNAKDFQIKVNGSVLDLDGFKILMQIESEKGVKVKSFSTENFKILITDAAAGKFRITEWEANIPMGNYFVDIRFISPSNKKKTYIKGSLPVTRSTSDV